MRLDGGHAGVPHGADGIVVVIGGVGDGDAFDPLRIARGQRLRGHAAHAQADKMHRPASGLGLDQRGRIIGQHVHGVRAGRCSRLAMAAVVIAQDREALLENSGHAVPHAQVAPQGMAEHDQRALTFAD